MPTEFLEWLFLIGLSYWWMGIGLVQGDFKQPPHNRPAYARSGGLHILPVIFYLPLAKLISPSIGGPGRVPKILVGALAHLMLTTLAFWMLGFLLVDEALRFAALAAVLLLLSILFLIPIKN